MFSVKLNRPLLRLKMACLLNRPIRDYFETLTWIVVPSWTLGHLIIDSGLLNLSVFMLFGDQNQKKNTKQTCLEKICCII